MDEIPFILQHFNKIGDSCAACAKMVLTLPSQSETHSSLHDKHVAEERVLYFGGWEQVLLDLFTRREHLLQILSHLCQKQLTSLLASYAD
jgi:hypothetical protein